MMKMKRKSLLILFAVLFAVAFVHGQNAGVHSNYFKDGAIITNVGDAGEDVKAEPGKSYSYNFADASELPQTGYQSLRYTTFVSSDGIITLKSNTDVESGQFGYHDSSHGAVLFPGNSIDMIVAGNATVTFATCQYGSASDAVWEFSDSEGTVLGSIAATNIGVGAAGTSSFTYTGAGGTITATLLSPEHPGAEIYIHGLTIENAAIIVESKGKTEVWDFGAVELDTSIYKNNLTVDIINAWYAESIVVGSSNNVLPGFSAGVLTWVGGGNDRLRSTNSNLTRYDENIGGVADYTGRVYVNSAANASRYMSLTLSEDDEVTIIAKTDAGGNMVFEYVADPQVQSDEVSIPSDLTEIHFVAKNDGTYHIFDTQGKPSYFRIYREDASYVTLNGSIDLTEASGIPVAYGILFTNEAGKTWTATMADGTYSVKLPIGYSYTLSLADANGFVISNGTSLDINESTSIYNVDIKEVAFYTVSGSISGLGSEIGNLSLAYASDPSANKIYVPEAIVNTETSTYTVQLEANCEYTISAIGVNDYFIPANTITIAAGNVSSDIVFEAKPRYKVNIEASGLEASKLAMLSLEFTNLNEAAYSYSFSSVDDIALRDGTYTLRYSGLEAYPVELGLLSNLSIDGADVTKTLAFSPVTNWPFNDVVITNGTSSYKGLEFTGTVSNEIAKGHLAAKNGATIKVPVKPGDKVGITYYYTADFSIEGGAAITTSSKSTSTFEYVDYTYQGVESGFVSITIGSGASTTYITNILIGESVSYKAVITVGVDKDYQTINGALEGISKMIRNNNERVTVLIDPGNYEEMLLINLPNVTLKNAAVNPDIALQNKGVDISDNAVRITSYYGHGYNYYSMDNDQRWHADILSVNKENGYLSYENKGAGTTNGSYWNATVVISANGFEAENIIFENSFNQYISKKESEDVVVMWESGNKGERPTDYGNTSVQNKSFVERAAAVAVTNNIDKVIFSKCRVIGRQDSFFGGAGSRVVVYKGAVMGGTDYLFGAMIAVFYKTDLVMNTSDGSSDVSYLTAAQQSSGRGYLMYECTVTSAIPGVETASLKRSKPGYYGRPWQASTSEVVFYNTTIETTDFSGSENKSLIVPLGWQNTLGGESSKMYEFGTIEKSGEDNISSRAGWSTVLSTPTLSDGTEITTFNFTKGNDGWDPLPALIAKDSNVGLNHAVSSSGIYIFTQDNRIFITNISSKTKIDVYSLNGILVKSFETSADTSFDVKAGLWIVRGSSKEGTSVAKILKK